MFNRCFHYKVREEDGLVRDIYVFDHHQSDPKWATHSEMADDYVEDSEYSFSTAKYYGTAPDADGVTRKIQFFKSAQGRYSCYCWDTMPKAIWRTAYTLKQRGCWKLRDDVSDKIRAAFPAKLESDFFDTPDDDDSEATKEQEEHRPFYVMDWRITQIPAQLVCTLEQVPVFEAEPFLPYKGIGWVSSGAHFHLKDQAEAHLFPGQLDQVHVWNFLVNELTTVTKDIPNVRLSPYYEHQKTLQAMLDIPVLHHELMKSTEAYKKSPRSRTTHYRTVLVPIRSISGHPILSLSFAPKEGYEVVPIFSGNNYNDALQQLQSWWKDIKQRLNVSVACCPQCHGFGIVDAETKEAVAGK